MKKQYTEILSLKTDRVLRDHRVHGKNLYPLSACIQLPLKYSQHKEHFPLRLSRISIEHPVIVGNNEELELLIEIETLGPENELVLIKSKDSKNEKIIHLKYEITAYNDKKEKSFDLDEIKKRCTKNMTNERFYLDLNNSGLALGLHLQTASSIDYWDEEVLGKLEFINKSKLKNLEGKFCFHPSILDGAIQLMGVFSIGKPFAYPYYIQSIELYKKVPGECWCYGWYKKKSNSKSSILRHDFVICDSSGEVILLLEKLSLKLP